MKFDEAYICMAGTCIITCFI